MFSISWIVNGQEEVVGPYEPAEAWQKMEEIFASGYDVVLHNLDTGSAVAATHPGY